MSGCRHKSNKQSTLRTNIRVQRDDVTLARCHQSIGALPRYQFHPDHCNRHQGRHHPQDANLATGIHATSQLQHILPPRRRAAPHPEQTRGTSGSAWMPDIQYLQQAIEATHLQIWRGCQAFCGNILCGGATQGAGSECSVACCNF